jgi:hypothetical protein
MIRSWLAAVLRGEAPDLGLVDCKELTEILAVANEEGVVALIHERMQHPVLAAALPQELRDQFAEAAQLKAGASLFREAECRRMLKRLAQEGLPALLLKGSALAYGVYASPCLRECSDIDFLFATRQAAKQAADILCEAGYIQAGIQGELATYEITCFRTLDSLAYLEMDLHWGIGSSPIYANCFNFNDLFKASIALPSLAPTARGLGLIHAYAHASMHRAINLWLGIGDHLKWLFDLHALGERFTPSEWEQLVAVCIEKQLCGTCLDGMQSAAATFHTSIPDGLRERLSEGALKEPIDMRRMRSWPYLQMMNLRAIPGWGLKARWLRQRVFPSGGYLHHYYGQGGGRLLAFTRYLKKGFGHLWE